MPASTQIIEAEVASRKVQPPPVATKPQPQPPPVAAKPAPVATRPQPPVVANPQPPVPASPPVPVAATPAPPARAAQPSPKLFREQALKHRLAAEEGRGLVRVSPPWTWAILWCVVAGLGAAIVASAVGQVEVTSRGRGVLRPTAGVLALTSQMTGTVARVERRSGERVEAGDTLLVIDSPAAQAQLLEADRQLDAVRTQFAGVATQQDRHYAEQIDSLRARAKRAEEQIDSLRSSVVRQQQRLQADEQLLAKGLMSRLAVAETRESLAQAQRQLSGAQQSLDQSRQELASMEARRQDELWQRKQMLDAAQTKRDSLALVLQQREVKASHAGVVEAMTVKVGEAVQAGQILGKIVPTESPLQVVSFLAEKDRAFAKPGDEVRLELDQLPHAEYGTLRAKVVRIGDDLASPQEMREALGDDQKILEMPPSYRVELQITDAGPADAAHVKLRTGTLMNVRYTLRRQKLITMVFTPLKRWFR
ncbi:MAG TPA: HlyD family efflux transporter periplasmic adaptor subunit [Anaeromyxobacteraceae bacterium]|nr:HlyD family efflux transporter periplasmic adaptor subunit [Anaeromyxobacteraceae bacterium]